MILDQIAWVDCFAFLLFLAPQMLIHVGLFQTAICGIKALPFLRKQGHILQHSKHTDQRHSLQDAHTAHT